MFSCEFCKTSKNTFFTEHLWATASAIWLALVKKSLLEFNLFSIIVTLFLMNLLYFIICKCMDTLSFQKWYCSIYSLLGQKIDIIIAAGWFIVIQMWLVYCNTCTLFSILELFFFSSKLGNERNTSEKLL